MPTLAWLVGITTIRSPCIVDVLELRMYCNTSIDKFPASASASERVRFVIISELNKPHRFSVREVSTSPSSRNAAATIADVWCIKMPHPSSIIATLVRI